jgi:periplasmic divalent cation tolerance protein
MKASLTLVACKNEREARALATELVQGGLAACATLLPRATSIYVWKGKFERSVECLLLVKSRPALVPRLTRRIRRLHSYSVPEILTLPVSSGNPDYLRWILASTRPGR